MNSIFSIGSVLFLPTIWQWLPETKYSFKHQINHFFECNSGVITHYYSDGRRKIGFRCIACNKISDDYEDNIIDEPNEFIKKMNNAEKLNIIRRREFLSRFGDKSHEQYLIYLADELNKCDGLLATLKNQ